MTKHTKLYEKVISCIDQQYAFYSRPDEYYREDYTAIERRTDFERKMAGVATLALFILSNEEYYDVKKYLLDECGYRF